MEKSHWVELFKFPLTIVTATFALLGISNSTNFEYFKIGPGSVEFKRLAQKANSDVATLHDSVRRLQERMDALPKTLTPSLLTDEVKNPPELATIKPANITTPLKGYIWLGNYKDGVWQRATLQLNASEASLKPTALSTTRTYKLDANLYLRDGQPDPKAEGAAYFANVKNLGVLLRDSNVKLVGTPIAYVRATTTQYWAEVEVQK